MFLRTVAERLSRGRAFKRSLSVGSRKAKIWVSGDAQLKYLKFGSDPFDRDLINIALACLEAEDVVWDVGANIGVFSVAAATRVKKVVAFEADIWLASLIRRTAAIDVNKSLRIEVVPAALCSEEGISHFQIAKRGRASNALSTINGRSQAGGVREEVLVPTLTLDAASRSLGPPDFIKIDVEGAELLVLLGGQHLLSEHKPLVYIEVSSDLFGAVTSFFQELGYEGFDQNGHPLRTRNPGKLMNIFFATDTKKPRLADFRELFHEGEEV